MEKKRAVSAPYFCITWRGSTTLFFDFDIFSMPPRATGAPSASATAPIGFPPSAVRPAPSLPHDLGPEARIQQMQHGMLDAADVLIHRHPVVIAPIDHRVARIGRAIAHV